MNPSGPIKIEIVIMYPPGAFFLKKSRNVTVKIAKYGYGGQSSAGVLDVGRGGHHW